MMTQSSVIFIAITVALAKRLITILINVILINPVFSDLAIPLELTRESVNWNAPTNEPAFTSILFPFRRSLKSLGVIPYRMRIQANDEVYETTKHRMAVAEENSKNKW